MQINSKRNARRGSLQGEQRMANALNCRCWFVGGVEVSRMLQLLGAADEIRSLRGSCEQGSNDGTKVKTILCRSHDIQLAAAEGETAPL